MRAIFERSNPEAGNIRTFWFRPERPMHYTAGQYTELTLRHDNPDDRGIKRWFTLSSAPGGELVSITTKYAGDGKSSTFKKTLFGLQPGAVVELAEAMGDFVLPKDASIPLVFVAGGIGITPFHSILEWLAGIGEHRNIQLVYGASTEAEIIFRDTFTRASVKPTIVLSDPPGGWTGQRGRLNAKLILRLTTPAPNALIYMSGPEPMVEALQKDLQDHGVAQSRLVGDFFPGYLAP